MIGQTISRYRILQRLGESHTGVVYEAEDPSLGRHVAVKVLPEYFTENQWALERFSRDARAAAALNHPGVRTIYDIGYAHGLHFIVMELLRGYSLKHFMTGRPLEIPVVLNVGMQVSAALAAAHAQQIIHRGISPVNIFITPSGIVKVLDFGLISASRQHPAAGISSTVLPQDLTTEGMPLGQISYMSPEQVAGRELDPRTDLFSLGSVLYEMATGVSAFVGETSALISNAILYRKPEDPTLFNRDLPTKLTDIISRALRKDPNERYQSAAEIEADMHRLKSPPEMAGSGIALAGDLGPRRKAQEAVRGLWRRIRPLGVRSGAGPHGFEVIRVLFATDRRQSGSLEPAKFFANERAEDGKLSLGICEVTIPDSDWHKLGRLEKPTIYRLEFAEDPRKHVILAGVKIRTDQEFFVELQQRVASSERKEALVFVHGYSVTFADAARRTAQFACDLRFDGAPILYSWPSRGTWWKYAADETNAIWSVPHLESFLRLIAQVSGARTVHLIAHSMGNRVLTSALELLVAKQVLPTGLFRHIVLTAPDIDSETFLQLAAAIAPAAERLTMYSNYKDRALLLSKLFHLYRRAGSTIVFVQGMDTIDASRVDTSLTRHSYFGSNRTVLADLSSLLLDGKPPNKRFGMRERQTTKGLYYVFRP